MFDLQKTLNLIKGGLLEPVQTWESYLAGNHDWKETASILTGPLILVSVVLTSILGWLFRNHSLFGQQTGFRTTILVLIGAVIGVFIAAFVFSRLAGYFQGKHDFNRGFAAVSLAAIPGYIGSILGTVPFIGWLVSLALGILGLVFLYRIIPSYLEVPEDKRVVHYVASLLSTIVLVFIVNLILGIGTYSAGGLDDSRVSGNTIPGEFGRQAELVAQAENDRYDPPEDGLVSEAQMTSLLATLRKTAEYQAAQQERLKKLEEDMQGKEDFSFSDIGKMTAGMNTIMSTANAEMEVVKSAGGNWAEHQWVKNQLRTASIQKDLNDTIKHNYALYQKYAEQLREAGL